MLIVTGDVARWPNEDGIFVRRLNTGVILVYCRRASAQCGTKVLGGVYPSL